MMGEQSNTKSLPGEQLDTFIWALKAQKERTVTSARKNNTQYTQILSDILNPDGKIEALIPETNKEIKAEGFAELSVNDPFFVLVNDIAKYIEDLCQKKTEFIESVSNKDDGKQSKLESISALISDLSHPKKEYISTPEVNTDPDAFELTVQKESDELSIDELLRQAQLAALAQDEQQKELNEKLKAEAQILNAKMTSDDVQRLTSEAPDTNKKDDSLIAQSDDAFIENEIVDSLSDEENLPKDENAYTLRFVEDMFDASSEEGTLSISKDIKDLYSVLSALDNPKVDITDNTRQFIYSSNLQKAIDDSLSGHFGNNSNVVGVSSSSSLPLAINSSQNVTNQATTPEYIESLPDNIDDDLVAEDVVAEYEDSNAASISTNELIVELNNQKNVNSQLVDGNPNNLNSRALELIEEEQNYENRALGRKLESRDFYGEVKATDEWYQDITNAGYNDGPTYSALCYSNRIKNSEYDWTIEMSSDFSLLISSPDFHHNLRTKFSISKNHPIEIKLVSVNGIPPRCPEDTARTIYLNTIDNERQKIASNPKLKQFIFNLGDDVATVNLGLYTQLELPNK